MITLKLLVVHLVAIFAFIFIFSATDDGRDYSRGFEQTAHLLAFLVFIEVNVWMKGSNADRKAAKEKADVRRQR